MLGALRHSDNRVRTLQRRLLAVTRQRVAATELLGLPRTHRLERVHGRDVRVPVEQLRQVPGELRIPRVTVGYFGSLDACCHEEVDRDRLQGRDVRRVACQRRPRLVGVYRGVLALRAPTMHLQLHPLRKLAGQVLDVDPRATVYVR